VVAKDVRKLPLLKRKNIVHEALQGSQPVRPVQNVGEHGQRLYDAACALQTECSQHGCVPPPSWDSVPHRAAADK
jgi:hypothetical protein